MRNCSSFYVLGAATLEPGLRLGLPAGSSRGRKQEAILRDLSVARLEKEGDCRGAQSLKVIT